MTTIKETYLIDPKYACIECGTLVLLEELKIYVHEICGLERLHHPEEDIDIARPFALDSWDRFRVESLSFSGLSNVVKDIANKAEEDNSDEIGGRFQEAKSDATNVAKLFEHYYRQCEDTKDVKQESCPIKLGVQPHLGTLFRRRIRGQGCYCDGVLQSRVDIFIHLVPPP